MAAKVIDPWAARFRGHCNGNHKQAAEHENGRQSGIYIVIFHYRTTHLRDVAGRRLTYLISGGLPTFDDFVGLVLNRYLSIFEQFT
jgi:hypothetical protein